MTLFEALIDDAAVFPPGNAAMPTAVPGYFRHTSADYRGVVGRFCCPASRLPECAAQLDGDRRLALGIIADSGPAGVEAALDFCARTASLVPRAVEVPVAADATGLTRATKEAAAAVPETLPAYVEVPRVKGWDRALDVLARMGRYAKLRTGGVVPEAFPPSAGVAAFIRGCVRRSLPFKCTAGLHHAIRWQDPVLGWNHGFLNVIAATHAALSGSDSGDIVDVLDQTSSDRVLAALPHEEGEVTTVRAAFHGFGSCSITDPVDDLRRLGLL